MRKVILSVIFVLTLVSFVNAQTNERRNLSDFTRVSLGTPGDLFIKIGSSFSVELLGSREEIENTETEVTSGKLVIRKKDNRLFNNSRIAIHVTMPVLEGLSVSGSGKAEIADAVLDADDLSLAVSGSGSIQAGRIESDNIACTISGSGNIRINGGYADSGDITISGSGSYSGNSLEIDKLDVTVSGSGNCSCRAGDLLTAVISGSGNITYRGEPRIDARVSGSGRVRQE